MTLWGWSIGVVLSSLAAWLGAGPLDSSVACAILGLGSAGAWSALYWFRLDRSDWQEVSIGDVLVLGFVAVPAYVALSFILGIDDGRRLGFVLSASAAIQFFGLPTRRLRPTDPPVERD